MATFFKGYVITMWNVDNGIHGPELNWKQPWLLHNSGVIDWDGHSRDQLPNTVVEDGVSYEVAGIWYPALGYFLRNGHVCWKGESFKPEDAEYKLLELVRKHENYEPLNEQRLYVSVYRNGDGYDCTNGGVSSNTNDIWVYKNELAAIYASYFEPTLLYSEENLGFAIRRCCYPVVNGKVIRGMFGGNFIATSDSRFEEYGGEFPAIKVHDRIEY